MRPAGTFSDIQLSNSRADAAYRKPEKTMRTLMNNNTFMVRIGRRTLIDKKNFRNG